LQNRFAVLVRGDAVRSRAMRRAGRLYFFSGIGASRKALIIAET